ncbi:MAG: hypothetical protein ACRDLF_07380 [Solirubrobacteraceae bacterium]
MPVDELQVGDRLRYHGPEGTRWQLILGFEELPQSRRIGTDLNGESWRLRRRTTQVVRAAREGERARPA